MTNQSTMSQPTSNRVEPTVKRGFIDVPWGQTHYREAGSGPPLVFLHQTALSSKSWEPVIKDFAGRFHVYAPDTPGYGDSTGFDEQPSFDWYVEALRLFLDGVGLDQAAFVGHHTGSSLAAGLARRYPERVSHIVLSMPPLFSQEEAERYRSIEVDSTLAADGSSIQAIWKTQSRSDNERLNLELVYWDVVESLRARPNGVWAIKALVETDLAADLKGVACPALVLHNPVDQLIRHRNRIMEAMPNARFELVESTTVDYFVEKAGIVTPMITEFVNSHS